VQDTFDLLAPAEARNATNFMIVRFGENHVKSSPVGHGAD
jgi:hypothetical protein